MLLEVYNLYQYYQCIQEPLSVLSRVYNLYQCYDGYKQPLSMFISMYKNFPPILLEVASGFHLYYQRWTLSTTHIIDKSYYPSQWH